MQHIILCVCYSLSHVQLFVMPWTIVHQATLSVEFSREEHCSGLPFPSPGESSPPRDQTLSLTLQTDSLLSEPGGVTVYIV